MLCVSGSRCCNSSVWLPRIEVEAENRGRKGRADPRVELGLPFSSPQQSQACLLPLCQLLQLRDDLCFVFTGEVRACGQEDGLGVALF